MAKHYMANVCSYVKTCSKCGGNHIKTVNTETRELGHVYRQKVCADCGYKFGTIEAEKDVYLNNVGNLLEQMERLIAKNHQLEARIAEIKAYVEKH